MNEQLSFIETQFPVSKVSKESYKERKLQMLTTRSKYIVWKQTLYTHQFKNVQDN